MLDIYWIRLPLDFPIVSYRIVSYKKFNFETRHQSRVENGTIKIGRILQNFSAKEAKPNKNRTVNKKRRMQKKEREKERKRN